MRLPIDGTNLALFLIGAIVVFGLFAKYIFKRFKLPDVALLIGLGVLLSQMGLMQDFSSDSNIVIVLVSFALIYIVFNGGWPISIKAVFSSAKWAFLSSIMHFIVITGVVFAISRLFFNFEHSLFVGFLLCVMDGSILNSFIENIEFSKKAEAFIQIESAIIDTLVIVAVVAMLKVGHQSFTGFLQQIVNFLILSSAIGVLSGIGWASAISKIKPGHHVSFTTLALLLFVYVFAEFFQANGVIAVFAFAITVGNTKHLQHLVYKRDKDNIGTISKEQKVFFNDISFMLRTLLFVYIGSLIDFSMPWYLLLGFALTFIAYLLRAIIFKAVKKSDIPEQDISRMEVMAAKGLTPVVMLSIIGGSPEFSNTIISAILSSVFMSAILLFAIEKHKFVTMRSLIVRPFRLIIRKRQLIKVPPKPQ
jgi:potassium/hydrogen antiporter